MFDGLQVQWLLDPDAVDMAAVFEDFLDRLRPRRASARVGRRHPAVDVQHVAVLFPDRRGEAKCSTASAMSSGRMLTPSVVRLR